MLEMPAQQFRKAYLQSFLGRLDGSNVTTRSTAYSGLAPYHTTGVNLHTYNDDIMFGGF